MTEEGKQQKRTVKVPVQTAAGKSENRFSKEQLLAAERFRERRDVLAALLETGELYTVKSVEERIENYMKGKVE